MLPAQILKGEVPLKHFGVYDKTIPVLEIFGLKGYMDIPSSKSMQK